jgi:hypothetical protein
MDNHDIDTEQADDKNRDLVLDGNAIAGLLRAIFSAEMTTGIAQCASCGRQGELGTLIAFTQSPGAVLRCPACEQVVMRIVETPHSYYIDARGAVFLKIEKILVS